MWLDDLSRERLRSGTLAALIRDRSVVGVTTSSTIVATALSRGEAAGIDLTDVLLTLENEGIAAFEKSWRELQDTVRRKLAAVHG